jgi:broad specificity phosphatase PhoE
MTEDLQTVVFLVRHGETDFAYVSDAEIDGKRVLTDRGRQQCRSNGEYLRGFGPVAIYASPLIRTVQSAGEIKDAAMIPGKVVTDADLYEIYDNTSWESIKTRLPRFFEKLINQHPGQHIVGVSHQDVIEGALRALGATAEEMAFPCRMGEMYRLVFAGKTFVQATKLCVNN